jgi:CheY-like chemotaxis protein
LFSGTKVNIIKVIDGKQVLEKLKKHKVDLVLMNIHLPKMSINEATEK